MKFYRWICRILFGPERKRVPNENPCIVFSGLHRVEKWVSKEDLERIIRDFFKNHNMDIEEMGIRLNVEFMEIGALGYQETPGESFQIGGQAETDYFNSISWVSICTKELRRRFNFAKQYSMLCVLAHELDHVVWAYENKGYFDVVLPYRDRPHEVRARKQQYVWVSRFKRLIKKGKPFFVFVEKTKIK